MTTPGTIICWDSGNLASEMFVGDRDRGVGSQVPITVDFLKKFLLREEKHPAAFSYLI